MRAARAALILRWLPAVAGAAYVATVVALWHELVENNNWDTDAVAKLVIAERLRGTGSVDIAHYGEWTTLWWLLATRWLPWHRDLWAASGYAFTLLTAAVLCWATWRVAGRWAGVTAAATALVVGPFVLRSFLSTTGVHGPTPVGAAVLAAVLVLLARSTSWLPAILGGLVAGANAASDPLLWVAGVGPFGLAAGLLFRSTKRRDVGLRAVTVLALALVSAAATSVVMRALDFRVEGADLAVARLSELPGNVVHLGRMLALFGGANYALLGPYPSEPLRIVVALLTCGAVAATVLAAIKLRRVDAMRRAYAAYWAIAVTLLCFVFVVTPNATDLGPKSVNYLLTLAFAAGAGVALLAAGSLRAEVAVAVCVAFVAATNIYGIVNGHAEVTGVVALPEHKAQIVNVLERARATRGYAGFWSAANLTWQTDFRLLVAPVNNCGAQLCPNNFFTIRSWYEPRGGPTFLLVDPTIPDIQAPPFVSEAAETRSFGPLKLYVFGADIAKHIRLVAPS
jgi:hypothetical protein